MITHNCLQMSRSLRVTGLALGGVLGLGGPTREQVERDVHGREDHGADERPRVPRRQRRIFFANPVVRRVVRARVLGNLLGSSTVHASSSSSIRRAGASSRSFAEPRNR